MASDETEAWRNLPIPAIAGLNAPAGFRAPAETVEAVNVAIALGQPLLVTGEPGCGKTTLAGWVADRLGCSPLLRFQTRSTATARDLFYQFDAIGRFNAARSEGGNIDPRLYISYTALGAAVLRALGRAGIDKFVPPSRLASYPSEAVRSVVLIDEIDKAPRDFPNDLLAELENFAFDIPELMGERAEAPLTMAPIVIITSNAERALPDAFLRRCVFHHMSFPSTGVLEEIVYARVAGLRPPAPLVASAVKAVTRLRQAGAGIPRPPGTAELLAFVLALRANGFEPETDLQRRTDWIEMALTTLVKGDQAQNVARRALSAQDSDEIP
jgi:MoxR-like ATPase